MSEDEQKEALYKAVTAFRDKNNIWSDEVVYQYDSVAEQFYEFVSELINIVGFTEYKEEDDED